MFSWVPAFCFYPLAQETWCLCMNSRIHLGCALGYFFQNAEIYKMQNYPHLSGCT